MTDTIDIRDLRARLDWTQDELADYLGLDRSSVSRMENGQKPKGPTRRLLDDLAVRSRAVSPPTPLAADPGEAVGPSSHARAVDSAVVVPSPAGDAAAASSSGA
jgi:transcriptional regulator with XRE-family HTH domain